MSRERRPHIGVFGRRNNGKSSIINKLAGQDVAIVSDVAGTTTDPVKKSFEITGFGPVILIDTAGIDDVGELGQKRIDKTTQAIKLVDLALLVITNNCFDEVESDLVASFEKQNTPYLVIHNKSDLVALQEQTKNLCLNARAWVEFNTITGNSDELIDLIKSTIPESA